MWCPKYRRPVRVGQIKQRLVDPIGLRCAEHDWPIVALGVMPDHVRLFVRPHLKDSASRVANQLKGFTPGMVRGEFAQLPTVWSRSLFVATVGGVSAATVRRFIDTQYERSWRKEKTG